MKSTKDKVIWAAIELYNDRGIANVTNQEIAKSAGISLSNLNYHFSTKQELVKAVLQKMREVLIEDVYGQNTLITSGDGWEIARRYFEYEQRFRFFYLDTPYIIRTYPDFKDELKKQFQESIQLIKNLNYLAIGKGLMKSEPESSPGLYDRLAEQIWMNNHFWVAQLYIRGIESDIVTKGLEAAMSITYPYLTPLGKEKFKETIDRFNQEPVNI